jgi:hypothetical protein
MDAKEPVIIQEEDAAKGKRILCVGRIHKGKKTMIIAFPQKGERNHAADISAMNSLPDIPDDGES